ncbi:MAG TPA: dihydrodipicolinate synthase family protein [Mycobacteriales bacterium]|nr:dihydrodipicolinate synthase family protein [Mycobacteriales bacterium]
MQALPAGVTVALATPLRDDGGLDEEALGRLLTRVLDAGVVGISPLGSTGEGARQATAARRQVIGAVRGLIPAGMPIVAGLPVTTVESALDELPAMAEAGADAALVAPPTYYPASDSDLEMLYTTLADRSPIPLVIYHIPPLTTVQISPAAVGRLAQHPRIIGIKDSSRELEFLQAVIYACEGAEFNVMTGSDSMLLASLLVGAHGTIAASANLVPALSVRLFNAVRDGALDSARDIQRELFLIIQACRRGAPPAGWKAALEIVGVCSARLVSPASRLPDELYSAVRADLERLLPQDVVAGG